MVRRKLVAATEGSRWQATSTFLGLNRATR